MCIGTSTFKLQTHFFMDQSQVVDFEYGTCGVSGSRNDAEMTLLFDTRPTTTTTTSPLFWFLPTIDFLSTGYIERCQTNSNER